MRIVLFGASGQVGASLIPVVAPLASELVVVRRRECDLADEDSVRRVARSAKADVIVNAAAYTAVDRAESEPALARAINARAPAVLAEVASETGAHLIHYSTDYVFDGSKSEPYVETDAVAPLGVYGATKLEGEEAIRASRAAATIFRTSWVFGPIGHNFVKTMLRLARERDSLRVVHDQVGNPTPAELLASVTALGLARFGKDFPTGTFHLAGRESVSWNDFARVIVGEARAIPELGVRLDPERVERITTADYPTPAKRPASSRLDTQKLEAAFQMPMPSYVPYLQRMMTLRLP